MAQPGHLVSHNLFGGAITTVLPSGYLDASDLRQIPDNQEVFLSPVNNASLIISLLERVSPAGLEDAISAHFEDSVLGASNRRGPNADTPFVRSVERVSSPASAARPAGGTVDAGVLVAAMKTSEQERAQMREKGGEEVVFTGIVMGIVRIASAEADLLIEYNVPHAWGQYNEAEVNIQSGKFGPMVEEALVLVKNVINGLRIEDWGLFGS